MPRKQQTFQTVSGPVTMNVPLSYEIKNRLRVKIDSGSIQRRWENVPYASLHERERMDIYLPNEGEGPFPVILFIHGGGWGDGAKDYWEVHAGFKALSFGFAVCCMEYRLAPECPHPAQIHDVKAAIRFLKAHGAEYELDTSRLALWGASAGGHLASLAGTSANREELTDRSMGCPDESEAVNAVVDWYGPTQVDKTVDDFVALHRFNDPAEDTGDAVQRICRTLGCKPVPEEIAAAAKAFSPITYISKDCPPFLIQHGTADPMVPVLQSIRFDQALTDVLGEEKVTLDLLHGQGHGSLVFEGLDNIKRVTDWLYEVMPAGK